MQVGSETLLQDISWRVEPGDKVGLVGTNGSGKSTLLRCLWGKLDVDSGELIVSPGANVGYLEQTAVAGSTRSVYEARDSGACSCGACSSAGEQAHLSLRFAAAEPPRAEAPPAPVSSRAPRTHTKPNHRAHSRFFLPLSPLSQEAKSQAPSTAAAVSVARLEALVSAAGPSTPVSELSPLLESLEEAKAAFEAAGGASAEKRVAEVLEGLGFKRTQWDTPCAALSGGWQMRVALARLLLSAAGEGAVSSSAASGGGGLLLLDEPTNHLDQKSAEWLARFLKRSSATTILVSHDEALLESACDKFAEVRGKTLHLYKGSYRRFLEQREARAVQAASQRAKLAGQAEKLEGFINRFGAKATKASAAKSKQKALDKCADTRTYHTYMHAETSLTNQFSLNSLALSNPLSSQGERGSRGDRGGGPLRRGRRARRRHPRGPPPAQGAPRGQRSPHAGAGVLRVGRSERRRAAAAGGGDFFARAQHARGSAGAERGGEEHALEGAFGRAAAVEREAESGAGRGGGGLHTRPGAGAARNRVLLPSLKRSHGLCCVSG